MRQSNRLNPFCKSPQAPAVPEALSQLCFSAAGASFSVHPKRQSFLPQSTQRAQSETIRLRRNNQKSTIRNRKSGGLGLRTRRSSGSFHRLQYTQNVRLCQLVFYRVFAGGQS